MRLKIILCIYVFLLICFFPESASADPISFVVAFAASFAAAGGIGGVVVGALVGTGIYAGAVWGVASLAGAFGSNSSSSSPTYKFGVLSTQANNTLAIPIVYGKRIKLAGNNVWQTDPESSTLKRIVAYADGPIKGFSDVKLDDTDIGDLPGCSYTAYTGTSSQTIDSRVTGKTTLEKVKNVGGLKNTAYLAITAKASSKLSGNFTSTAIIDGSLVRVYSSLTEYVDGICSNNPAWCLLDFLTRYNGCGCSYDDVDIQSFIDVAEYCDEVITNNLTGTISTKNGSTTLTGTGTAFKSEISVNDTITINGISKTVVSIDSDTTLIVDSDYTQTLTGQTATQSQPRFTLNLVMDERKSRLDWISDICLVFQGFLVYKQGLFYLDIEKPDIVLQVFDKNNIITDSETFATVARENRFDIVKVQYPSPVDEYALIYAQAEAEVFQNEQPIVKEITLYGVTNHRQASRLAWFHLNQSITCTQQISLKTTKEGLDRMVGDLIAVTSTFGGFVEKKYRINKMSEPQEGQIEISALEYNADLYCDKQGSATPVVNTISLGNPSTPPISTSNIILTETGYSNKDGVHISNILIDWDDVKYQYFNNYFISCSTDNGITWNNIGVSYENSFLFAGVKTGTTYLIAVQSVNQLGLMSDKVYSSLTIVGKDEPPPDVTELTYIIDPTDTTRIKLKWPGIDIVDLRGYEIREGLLWDLGTPVTSLLYNTEEYTYTFTENRDYNFWIKAVDNSYNYSQNPVGLAIKGNINPLSITNFQAFQNGDNVLLSWDKSDETDIIGCEIREGKNWDIGSLIVTGVTNTTYQFPVSTEKTYYYMIKAINRAGNYSLLTTFSNVIISNLSPLNVIENFDELTLKSGTLSNLVFGASEYTWDTVDGCWDDYPNTTWDALGSLSVLTLDKNNGEYYASGTYTSSEKDMGQNITADINIDYYSNAAVNGNNFSSILQYRTKLDGNNYTDWQNYIGPIQKTFRYFQIRVVLTTTDTTKSPQVSILNCRIDVPDVIKSGKATIAVGGTNVSYGHTYYTEPFPIPCAIGSGLRAEIQNVSQSSFVVKVLNTSNVDVGGNINFTVKGY